MERFRASRYKILAFFKRNTKKGNYLKWGLLYFIRNPSLAVSSYCSVLTCLWFLCDTGDTLYYRFTSDMSNTEWGYKFTVTAGHLGRFQTGVCSSLSLRRPLPGTLCGCKCHYVIDLY